MIQVKDIPLNPHSSDFSDSSESIDDSLSHNSKKNEENFSLKNYIKEEEEEIGNSFISIIPNCSSPEEKNDDKEDIKEILKDLEGNDKKGEKKVDEEPNKAQTDFTSKKFELIEESFWKEDDKTFLQKKRKQK